MLSFINVQTGILMDDVPFDVVGDALTATAGPTAWFDRDTRLQEGIQSALAGAHFEDLVGPSKIDFE